MFSLASSLTTSLEKLFSSDGGGIKVDLSTSNSSGVMYVCVDVVIALSSYLLGDGVIIVVR